MAAYKEALSETEKKHYSRKLTVLYGENDAINAVDPFEITEDQWLESLMLT